MMHIRRSQIARTLGAIFLLVAAGAAPAQGQAPAKTAENGALCAPAIAAAARAVGVPAPLMAAISLAESGRWDTRQRASVAWPWTVTAGGKGQFLPSKAAAIAHVEALRAQGVRNIDVGCMQVNLMYHPAAFADLDAAFDPHGNAAYAAGFLARLSGNQKTSWWQAVGRYHSSTPHLAQRYQAKVARLLGDHTVVAAAASNAARRTDWLATAAAAEADAATRRATANARRQQVIAAYLAKRAARKDARGG